MTTSDIDAAGEADLHPLGRLYQQWALDFVIEAAVAVAQDHTEHGEKFAGVSRDVTDLLRRFRSADDGSWPRFAERNKLYDDQLGEWFSAAAGAFRSAVVSYVERGGVTSPDAAKAALTDAVSAFRTQLRGDRRTAAADRQADASQMFDAATAILRSESLAAIYGQQPAPGAPWPFGAETDRDAAELVDAIATELFPAMIGRMSQYKFLLLQRTAHHGALTISRVLADHSHHGASFDALVEAAYSWCLAIRELMPVSTIVAAWQREYQRMSLSGFEQALLPDHPAGEVALPGTELEFALMRSRLLIGIGGGGIGIGTIFGGGTILGFETQTIGDGVCCSTGDLNCVTDASCVSVVEHCPTEGLCPTSPGSGLSCNGPCGTGAHHC